jgi:hypothetical protein
MGISNFFTSIGNLFKGSSSTSGQSNSNSQNNTTTNDHNVNSANVKVTMQIQFECKFPLSFKATTLQGQTFNLRQVFALLKANQEGKNVNDLGVFQDIMQTYPNQSGDTLFQPTVSVITMSSSN